MIQGQSSHLYQEHLQQHYGQHQDIQHYGQHIEEDIVTKFETLNNSEEWENCVISVTTFHLMRKRLLSH